MNDVRIQVPAAAPPALLATVLEQLPAGAYFCDATGLITYYNARAVELWGRTPRLNDPVDRWCGSFRLYTTDGDPIRHDACWMALALRDLRPYVGQPIIVERPDGERRRALAHASPVHDESGRLVGAVNVLVDVTEESRAKARLDLMLNSIEDHLVQYDRQWRYTYVTEKGAAAIGKTPAELLGKCIWEVFPEAVGNTYYRALHEAAATGETRRFEFYYEPFQRWFENHIYPGPEGVSVFSTDITHKKRAEEELRRVEQQHAELLDIVPAGVFRIDGAGIVRYYNQRAAEIWGRAPDLAKEEVKFCGSYRLYLPDGTFVPHPECPMAEVLKTGQPVSNLEVVMERPDGERVTVLANIKALFDERGTVVGAVNMFQDISERKRDEETRSRLAAIVESSFDAVIGKDLDGRVISWNAAAERLYGYTPAEMIGQPAARLYPPERREEEDRILARIRAGERVEHFETQRVTRSGRPIEVSVTVSPVRDGRGRIVGASSVSHDISERKTHERALRASEARYRSLAEASGAIVVVSNGQAEWLAPQPAWEAYTGQSFAEYRGHGWVTAIHPDDRERIEASVRDALGCGKPWHAEARVWHAASGTYRHQEARAVPIRDADGHVLEWVGTVVDVHARKTAEEAVREADRRKDEFLAVLSHELRNPLAPIVSSVQMLRLPDAAHAHASALDIIERQAHHLVRLVDDLMEVSRITRGAIELRREPVHLADAVRAAVEISRPLLESHDHQLALELADGPHMVHGDRVRLTQIVANLLNNAAKYTPRSGRIRVALRARGSEVLVTVADNGVGVALDQQDRIFEMFQRGDRSVDRFTTGLGVGLGLSRQLAQLHGGNVEVYSAGENQGSEFTLRLPLAVQAPVAVEPRTARAASERSRRVLVVDDNRDAAESLAELLRALGHEVRTAHDGAVALEAAAEFRPEVALLDLGMPGTDGFEVARRVRGEPWGAEVRLVALSGWGLERDRRRSRECGFDLHLVKPVALDQVRWVLAH